MWQSFGSRGVTGVKSVSRNHKLSPCPTEPVSAGSKADLPLAKVEPINNVGSVSVIMCLRRGKNAVQQWLKEGSENV